MMKPLHLIVRIRVASLLLLLLLVAAYIINRMIVARIRGLRLRLLSLGAQEFDSDWFEQVVRCVFGGRGGFCCTS